LTLGTADELFAELLADDATPSPGETVAFMVDAMIERAVNHPVLGVDMSRVALHAWVEALRDPEIADRVDRTLRHLRRHYAHWQAAGHIDDDTDPEHVGAAADRLLRTSADCMWECSWCAVTWRFVKVRPLHG
jgi:hypothetical protein